MAHITTHPARPVRNPLTLIHALLQHMAETRAKTRTAEALLALPQAELSARDLTREDLVRTLP